MKQICRIINFRASFRKKLNNIHSLNSVTISVNFHSFILNNADSAQYHLFYRWFRRLTNNIAIREQGFASWRQCVTFHDLFLRNIVLRWEIKRNCQPVFADKHSPSGKKELLGQFKSRVIFSKMIEQEFSNIISPITTDWKL